MKIWYVVAILEIMGGTCALVVEPRPPMTIFAGIILILLALLLLWAILWEKREWNNGICRRNGLPWEQFDTDSQGGRGYKAGERKEMEGDGHER